MQEALHVAMGVEAPAGLNLGQRLWVYLRPYQMFVDDLPARHDCLAHPDDLSGAAVAISPDPLPPTPATPPRY